MPIIQHLGTAYASGGGANTDPLLAGGGLYFGPYAANGTALTGYLGPVKADLRTYYKSILGWGTWVDDDAFFNTTSTGIQVWNVPESRVYRITMESPSHHVGNCTGWKMEFNRAFTSGDRLFILPGHRCSPNTDGNSSYGGNGGTFLVKGNSSESNLDTDLLNRNVSDVIAICGGSAKASGAVGNATGPGSHPSGSDLETSNNYGSGRSLDNYHGFGGAGGPSGGAGFLKGACQHDASNSNHFVYSDKQDSTSFLYDADSFVRGGLGGRGYDHTQYNNLSNAMQSNNGMNGSGGFGGGGGQSIGNSYSSGAGGMMGGAENDGAQIYPNSFKYTNNADRIGGGSSYIKSGITLIVSQASSATISYVKIKNN